MGENNIETHDILIGAVIAIILLVQFAVFFVALKKIKLLKRIIPDDYNFRIVKVVVREDRIKDLSVNGVLENQGRYSNLESEEQVYTELTDETTQIDDDTLEDDYLNEGTEMQIDYDGELYPETEIWISKENKEKKIQYQFLEDHEASGWTRIK